ncbi:MAG TPA: hypothetical protein VK427_16230, partial [Kofleriaceae bacterium]|nr:hypothetical protein [Kofleriaceae bacterium]
VSPYGSILYAPAFAADIDVLVETDLPVADFARELATIVDIAAAGSDVHLRGTLDGHTVEVAVSSRAAPDERVLAGPRDGAALLQHLRDHGRHAAFLALWPELRRFIAARGLAGNGLGYIGSFGWALLLAIPLCHDTHLCRDPVSIRDWFAHAAVLLEPGAHVSFTAGAVPDTAPIWLAAPTPPSRNVARGITAGTLAVLREELRHAARSTTLDDLAIAPPRGTTLYATGPAETRGIYEGKFRALLDTLESTLGPVVRPWGRFERSDTAWQHGITVPDAAAGTARSLVEHHLRTLDARLSVT